MLRDNNGSCEIVVNFSNHCYNKFIIGQTVYATAKTANDIAYIRSL